MGCLVRIIGVIAFLVFAVSVIMIFMKWLASGMDYSWGTVWTMFGVSMATFGVCVFIVQRD